MDGSRIGRRLTIWALHLAKISGMRVLTAPSPTMLFSNGAGHGPDPGNYTYMHTISNQFLFMQLCLRVRDAICHS